MLDWTSGWGCCKRLYQVVIQSRRECIFSSGNLKKDLIIL